MGRNKQRQVGILFLVFFLASPNTLAREDAKADSYNSKTTKESQKISPQKEFLDHSSPSSSPSTKGSFFSSGVGQFESGVGQFDNPMIFSIGDLRDRAVSLPEICRTALRNPVDLETRLNGCPWLRDQIVWETGNGTRISYPEWTPTQKERLEYFFQALLRGDHVLGIHCPDPAWAMAPSSTRLYLSVDQAFDIYAAHVAHVFYLEATHRVPWSITNLPPQELEELLASYSYQSRIISAVDNYYPPYIQAGRDFQRPFRENGVNTLVCDPRDGYRFIRGETSTIHRDLLGTTEEETLKNITWWFYNNVRHTTDEYVSRVDRAQYAYLRDRLRYRGGGVAAPAGCHTAANLFYDLAKSVNIPLKVGGFFELDPLLATGMSHYGNTMHGGLIFRWARPGTKVLWHADLIYANYGAIFPVEEGLSNVRMREEGAKQKLFETTWLPPTVLQSWGFHYFSELPTITPGVGYGLHSRGAYEDAPDYGELGGFWQLDCSQDFVANSMPCLEKAFMYENQFQLCAWIGYLESYCLIEGSFYFQLNLDRPVRPPSFSLPAARSGEDNFRRIERCVQAYSGCGGLNTLISEYNRNFGTDTWADR